MYQINKNVWTQVTLILLAAGLLVLAPNFCSAAPAGGASAVSRRQSIRQVQKDLRDKGYYTGKVDGIEGPQTRKAIRQYQKAEGLSVTGRLDARTAGKLGVGQESVGGSFEQAGRQVGEGSEQAGHQIEHGKPVAAGKDFGKGVGRFGKDVGKGVKKAVNPKNAPNSTPPK
ncbi:MAG: peptidoglycan-binding domain-containing protein [Terriglobia bacterium]